MRSATQRHSVTRIHRQVEQSHLELRGICQRWPKVGLEIEADPDQWPNHAMQEVLHTLYECIRVDRFRRHLLPARECKHLRSERSASFRRMGRHGEQTQNLAASLTCFTTSSNEPSTAVSKLLKSWAIPPVS